MDCCDSAGGRVTLTINGVKYSTRSAITVRPTNVEREAGANMDGTVYVTTKPMPAEMEFTLSDRCGLALSDLVENCHVDVTAELIDVKRTYLFSRATVVGRPELDTESGEISGLKIVSFQAQQLNA